METDDYTLGEASTISAAAQPIPRSLRGTPLGLRVLPLLTAVAVVTVSFGLAWVFRESAVGRHLLDRGFTQPLTVALFGWGIGHALSRWWHQRRERLALEWSQHLVARTHLEQRSVDELATQLAPMSTTLAGSVAAAVVSYFTTQRPTRDEVMAVAHKAIDRCIDAVEVAYRPLSACMWLLPLSGFLGTVVGMSEAISGFEGLTEGAAPGLSALAAPIAGLGKAFDTTLLALVLVIPLKLLEVGLEGRDERLIEAIDRALGSGYVMDLKLAGLAQQNPLEAVLDRYAERVERLERSLAMIDDALGDVAQTLQKMPGLTQALAHTGRAAALLEARLPQISADLQTLRELPEISAQLEAIRAQNEQPITLMRGAPRRPS